MAEWTAPLRPIRQVVLDSGDPGYVNRILIGTPTTGLVRIEWHAAVRSMLVPMNWSQVSMVQPMSTLLPLRFQIPDAQNIIVREAVEKDFEWLLLLEHDTIPPPDMLVRLNDHMRSGEAPVVSGLYYSKGEPSEPLIFRGRGTGAFLDFQMGEKVWCDGVPTGCLLIHGALLRAMWQESEDYECYGQRTRRVFETPTMQYVLPSGEVNTISGTSDLQWCTRVMDDGFFAKAGWAPFGEREYPFLVDTAIRCQHITEEGVVYPIQLREPNAEPVA